MKRSTPLNYVLLATSSVVAMIAAGSGPAQAACPTISGTSSGFTNPNGTTIPCLGVNNATVTGNVVNAGTITPGTTGNGTGILAIGGTIVGSVVNSGAIIVRGSGINLNGVSTFTGAVINSGSISSSVNGVGIEVRNGTNLLGSISNSGTISSLGGIAVTNESTFSGGITNSGTISGGVGILVSGGATFSGAIANSGNITGTTAAIDVSAAPNAITINQTGGTITGAIKLSPFADVLNVTGGAINGNIVGQGLSNVVNFSLGNSSFTYGSAFSISGVNQLNVNSGLVIFDGINTYTGSTTINGGTLEVDGSIASSRTVTVNSAATLTGVGTVDVQAIGSTTINAGGTLAPGRPGMPGTFMTIGGNLIFRPGATYAVWLNPSSATYAVVVGTATLAGTVSASFATGSYMAHQQYDILRSAGLGGTTFAGLTINNPNFITGLSYTATDVLLNLNGFALGNGTSLTVNQHNAADAINGFFNNGGTMPPGFSTLFSLTGGSLSSALSQVTGETATGSQQTTFDAMDLFMGLLTDPFMQRNRSSGSTPGASGYADEASAYAAATKKADAFAMFTKAPPAPAFEQRWSVWGAGFGGSQSTASNTVLGSNNTTSGIAATAVGADYLVSPGTIAGFALAGGGTSFSVATGGSGRSDLFQAGAYLRHTEGPAYISAALAYGWQDITTNRTVTVAGLDQLRAEFNANAYSGRLEGGYRFVAPATFGVGITPYAAAQFVTFDLPAYTEAAIVGGNTFALAYGAKDVTDPRTELGIRTDKSWAMASGILTLRGRLAWDHDYDPNRAIAATFQALPGASFVVNGAAQAADSALTTASIEMKWNSGWSAVATFEGEFSNLTSSYAGKGVVRYQW